MQRGGQISPPGSGSRALVPIVVIGDGKKRAAMARFAIQFCADVLPLACPAARGQLGMMAIHAITLSRFASCW
jgi:hypothetical protein